MAIRVQKNSVRNGAVKVPPASTRRATQRPSRRPSGTSSRSSIPSHLQHRPSDTAWVKWVVAAVLVVVGITVVVVAAAHDRRPRVSKPNLGDWQRAGSSGASRPRSALDSFDMKAWCEENDKSNEALQARRRRRAGR